MSKMNRWILGLTIFAVLAMAGAALAGGVGSGRDVDTRGVCTEALDGALCEADADVDCAANCENADSELCAEGGRGREAGARTCQGGSRPLDGSGVKRGGGQGQRTAGCRGGRF